MNKIRERFLAWFDQMIWESNVQEVERKYFLKMTDENKPNTIFKGCQKIKRVFFRKNIIFSQPSRVEQLKTSQQFDQRQLESNSETSLKLSAE